MKKKILLAFFVMIVGIFAFGMVDASTEIYGDLTYNVSDGEVTITDCNSSSTRVDIPEKINGYPVTTIGDFAFAGCSSLTSVTIPDSVTSIGGNAFAGCGGLMNVMMPDSVTTIGDYAFYCCNGLTSVTVPERVTIIGVSAFEGCNGLASVEIGDSVTNIGNYAFMDCSGLTSVMIPDSVTTIGRYAFYGCDGLTNVTIPDSVTSIGNYAFYGCSGLMKVNITDVAAWCNIEFGDSSANPLCYAKKLYLNGEQVTNLTIPSSVTSVGNYAFYKCDGLTSVTMSDSVTTIGDGAFYYCDGVTSVEIPDSVIMIDDRAFAYCSSLTSVTISDSVTTIGSQAFLKCNRLTSVTIGSGVELIPENAFYNCSKLKYVGLSDELLYIRNDAFNGCTSISTVFYEGSEEEWQSILFYNRNENLTSAKIVYNAEKRTYKFETNCDDVLPDITDFAVFTSPVAENEGSTLIGWYDNADLEGDAVTFPYYGDATTLYAAWTGRTGKSFDDALIAKVNREYTVTTTKSGELVYFEFIPTKSKSYNFYSTGSKDTYGYLYNSSKTQLTSNDDSGDGNNFLISYNLTAGNTYYIAAKIYSGTGTFTFGIEEPVDYRINSVTLKDTSGNTITSIPKGEFLATVSFTNISSSEDSVVVLAQYTNIGAFKGLMYVSCEDVPTSSTMKLTIPVDNKDGDITKLKALCWSSIGSMDPMGDVVSFPAE